MGLLLLLSFLTPFPVVFAVMLESLPIDIMNVVFLFILIFRVRITCLLVTTPFRMPVVMFMMVLFHIQERVLELLELKDVATLVSVHHQTVVPVPRLENTQQRLIKFLMHKNSNSFDLPLPPLD